MEEKLKRAALRLQEVELLLSQPEVYADPGPSAGSDKRAEGA